MQEKDKETMLLEAAMAILSARGKPNLANMLASELEPSGPKIIRKFTAVGGAGILHKAGQNRDVWNITKIMIYEGEELLGSALVTPPVEMRVGNPAVIRIEGRS